MPDGLMCLLMITLLYIQALIAATATRCLQPRLELTESFIRKAAHFSEYFAIGGLLMSCAYGFDRLRPQRFGVRVLFAGMLTALIDETIQLFSEGRAGMIADVWIDMGGVVCGAALMLGFYTLLRRRRAKKKRKTDFEG